MVDRCVRKKWSIQLLSITTLCKNILRTKSTACWSTLCYIFVTGSRREMQPACRYCYHGPILGFSPHRGDKLHRSRWNLTGRKFHLDRLRGIWNFTNIIATKGRVPCTFPTFPTKFTGFMRVLSLHNFAKFGCFSSINDKIIYKQFTSAGAFSAKFSMTPSD